MRCAPAGYMINANATLGGGCPVPPPPTSFLNQVGEGLAATVEYGSDLEALFGDQTEAEVITFPETKRSLACL